MCENVSGILNTREILSVFEGMCSVFLSVCVSHHVYQLCDGEAKLDDDHVGDVARRTRPLVVAPKQTPEELVLRVDTSPVFSQH